MSFGSGCATGSELFASIECVAASTNDHGSLEVLSSRCAICVLPLRLGQGEDASHFGVLSTMTAHHQAVVDTASNFRFLLGMFSLQ